MELFFFFYNFFNFFFYYFLIKNTCISLVIFNCSVNEKIVNQKVFFDIDITITYQPQKY